LDEPPGTRISSCSSPTDYHLGETETGVEVIGASRRQRGADFKAILITGDTSSVVRGMQLDHTSWTTSKPLNADELLSLIVSSWLPDRPRFHAR